jgi:pimeloyl-ACP methyl ester carboxylesterase
VPQRIQLPDLVVEPVEMIGRQTEVDCTVDLTGVLGEVTAPTLVLGSAHDRLIDDAQQRALVTGIQDARYAEIDAGHGAWHGAPGEDPAAFVEAVVTFLATIDRARAA